MNDEEIRQLAMQTYETAKTSITTATTTTTTTTTVNTTTANTNTVTSTNNQPTVTTSNTTIPPSTEKTVKTEQRNDGAVSDSALSSQSDHVRKRRPSMSSKAFVILGLSKKANSSSSLGKN